MLTQPIDRCSRGHRPRTSAARVTESDSVRGHAPIAKRILAALLLSTALGLLGCHTPRPRPGGELELAGAQIATDLVQSWLRDARKYSFATALVSPVHLSQHGFRRLAANECDLACTDRRPVPAEIADFPPDTLRGHRVAFFGYALYVHPDNPLDAIYAGHLKMVFRQEITDWHTLVGDQLPDFQGPIHLHGPPKGSRAGQILAPIAKIWFADATWTEHASDQAIVDAVARDPLAIGFASIGYDHTTRYLGLRMHRRGKPAFPSLEEIESERYGLAKVIYVYHRDPPTPAVAAALDYLYSDEGARAIEETDIWPISRDRGTLSAP